MSSSCSPWPLSYEQCAYRILSCYSLHPLPICYFFICFSILLHTTSFGFIFPLWIHTIPNKCKKKMQKIHLQFFFFFHKRCKNQPIVWIKNQWIWGYRKQNNILLDGHFRTDSKFVNNGMMREVETASCIAFLGTIYWVQNFSNTMTRIKINYVKTFFIWDNICFISTFILQISMLYGFIAFEHFGLLLFCERDNFLQSRGGNTSRILSARVEFRC